MMRSFSLPSPHILPPTYSMLLLLTFKWRAALRSLCPFLDLSSRIPNPNLLSLRCFQFSFFSTAVLVQEPADPPPNPSKLFLWGRPVCALHHTVLSSSSSGLEQIKVGEGCCLMLRLVANKWPIGTSTSSDEHKDMGGRLCFYSSWI